MLGGRTIGSVAVWISVILAAGCGGSTNKSGTGGSGGTAGTAGASGSGGTGGTAGSGGTGGTAGSGGTAGTAGAGGTAGGGALTASISQSQIYVNCMPMVPADPVNGSFDVLYDNQNGTQTTTASITSARFVMKSGNNTLTWSFAVTPTGSGPVVSGNTKTVTHTKTAGSGTGQGTQAPCNYCGGTGTLQVTWQSGGKSFSDSTQPANILCAM